MSQHRMIRNISDRRSGGSAFVGFTLTIALWAVIAVVRGYI